MPNDIHDCPDCTVVTADDGDALAAGVQLCAVHRAESVVVMEHARATNPEVVALHRILGLS